MKEIKIMVTVVLIISSLIIMIGLLEVASAIKNHPVMTNNSNLTTEKCISNNIENKMYLTDIEASRYLGISYEAIITLVKSGEYKGGYITEQKDGYLEYVFSKDDLDKWFNENAAKRKEVKVDQSLLPEKR
jgi:hypothetical protein